jgi:predicted nucleotidyltransferase
VKISDIRDAVAQIAPAYPVLRIDLFGSFAEGKGTEDSDVDLLVYFDEKVASLFDLSGLKFDIQEKLNTKVDVVAGPLKENSYLTIDKKVRIYEV